MEIKVYNNVFDNEYKTFEYDTSKPLLEQLEEHIEKETYRETLVECYDPQTGETFYAPMLDEEIENPSVMIVVNGKSVDKDYQPKEGELVSVVFLPASERAGNITAGAIIGAGVGITLAGLLLLPFAGGMFASAAMAMAPQLFGLLGISGAVIGGFAGNEYYNNHGGKINGTIDSGKQGTQSPDVRGAENSSIRGENFSFVIGKHLVAPRIIGDPVTEYSGPRGEDAYVRTLYQIGYAPLKLTEFKLGEFMLAYNRDHKIGDGTTVECGTYVAGHLKGYSRGNVPDSGDILDYWKNNDIELEIIQQPNQGGEAITIDDEYQNNTVIDLANRPRVPAATMHAAGWTDVPEGDYCTIHSIGYSNEEGTLTVLLTPINPDGTVLTPAQLDVVAEDCLIPSEPVVATVKFNVSYNPAPYQDPYVVSQMKLSLNAVISSSVELQVNSNNAWVSVLTLPSGAISSQLSDNPRWAGNTCRIKIGSWTSSSFVVSGSGTETINTPEIYQAPEHPENLLATFTGSDSIEKSNAYAIGLHENQEAFYNDEHYDDGVNYGSIYTSTYDDQQINANLFYIADKELDDNAKVVYKGSEFPNKFRTNGVFFTAACPMEFTITLDFQNGLYDTYTKTEDNTTTTHYDAIPLYLCVQWRIYSSTNKSSDPTGGDYDDWNTINIGTMKTLNATVAAADKAKHKGNDFGNKTLEEIYGGFYGKQVSDFSSYAGEDGLSEIRISKTVTLTKAQCEAVLADTNKGRLIEVRVLRVSPNYMNMVSDDGLPEGESAHSYSDHVKVISILTKVFDEEKLKKEDTLTDIKPLSDEDYKKFCLVAIKAKADASGYISQQLKSLSCIAESFSPIWDSTEHKVLPENITTVTKYFGYYKNGERVNRSSDDDVTEQEVTKAQYEEARRDGFNWYAQDCGTNYASVMKNIIFTYSFTHNGGPAYKLTETAAKYNNNTAASGFLLGCFGPQNGPIGIGSDGVNLAAIGEWAEKTLALKDGSTFDADTEYNGVQYHDGDEIPVRMEANAYIYAATKLEDLLQKLAFCGRAAWFVDENGKISVLMDGPVDYTKGVINAQNCISSSNAFSYEEPPAGLYISFSDENDGYQTNQFYCWSDGNSPTSYHGQVEPYSIEFVTNPYQIWSLGRYLLALREMNREVLTRKIGVEGATYNIGNVVLLQSEDLLIGDCSGRIQEVIEDENYIYGFVCNSPYEYNAEQGEGEGCSTQGVTIMQPRYYGKSNAVTLPISMPRTQTVGDKSYTLAKGTTNVVLFKEGVPKGDNDPSPTQDAKYNFKTGDICMFGLRDYISAPYRITKIKPEKDGTFTQTLIPYDEGLYNAGAQIPSFQSFMPPPVVEEAPVSLSEVPTTLKEQNDTLLPIYKTIENLSLISYSCLLTMSAIGSAVTGTIYKDGVASTDNFYYVDYYGTQGTQPTTAGAEGVVLSGSFTISAVEYADKHKVMIYSDNTKTQLICTAFVSFGDGSGSSSYWLIEDASTVKKDKNGNFTPSTINLTAKKQTGTNAPENYVGRIGIAVDTGSGYGTESYYEVATKEFTIPADTVLVRCRLYLAGGTTTLLDEDIVTVVADGQDADEGINLFRLSALANKRNFKGNSTTNDWTAYLRYYNGSASIHSFTEYAPNIYQDTITLAGNNTNIGIAFARLVSEFNLDPASDYTISFWAKCSISGAKVAIGLSYRNTEDAWVWRGGTGEQAFTAVNTWQYFTRTFKPDADTYAICYCMTVKTASAGTWSIRQPKLEKGKVATTWTPAPQDIAIDTTVQDYCETATNVQPTTGWGAMPSTLTAGYYLWTRTTITYLDGTTSISYSSSRNGQDGATGVPNGAQIIRGTVTTTSLITSGSALWANKDWRRATSSNATITSIDITDCPNPVINKGWRLSPTAGTASSQTLTDLAQDKCPMYEGIPYTISCWARKANNSDALKLRLQIYKDTNRKSATALDITTEWEKYSFTWTPTASELNVYFGVYANQASSYIEICGMKCEVGETMTDWCEYEGDVGERGAGLYKITTAPTAYTTTIGGFTPSYRIALSTVLSESGATKILVGDVLEYSYYHYPVGYNDGTYVYTGARTSIRGAPGAQGVSSKGYKLHYEDGYTYCRGLASDNTYSNTAQPYVQYNGENVTITKDSSNYVRTWDNSTPASGKRANCYVALINATPETWASGNSYQIGAVVTYNNSKYICYVAHTSSSSILPTKTSYWASANIVNVYYCYEDDNWRNVLTGTGLYDGTTTTRYHEELILLGKISSTTATSKVITEIDPINGGQEREYLLNAITYLGIVGTTSNNYYTSRFYVLNNNTTFTRQSSSSVTADIGTLVIERGHTGTTGTGTSDANQCMQICNGNNWETVGYTGTGTTNSLPALLQKCQNMAMMGLVAMAKVYSANNVTLPKCCGQVFDLLIANSAFIGNLVGNTAFINQLSALDINFKNSVASYKESGYVTGNLAISMGKNPKNSSETGLNFNIQSYRTSVTQGSVTNEIWNKEFYTENTGNTIDLVVKGGLSLSTGLQTFSEVVGGCEIDGINFLPNYTGWSLTDTGYAVACLNQKIYVFKSKETGKLTYWDKTLTIENDYTGFTSHTVNKVIGLIYDAKAYENNIYLSTSTGVYKFNGSTTTQLCDWNTMQFNVFDGKLMFACLGEVTTYDGTTLNSIYINDCRTISEFTKGIYVIGNVGQGSGESEMPMSTSASIKFYDKNFTYLGSKTITGKTAYFNGTAYTLQKASCIFAFNGNLITIGQLTGAYSALYFICLSKDGGETWYAMASISTITSIKFYANKSLGVIRTKNSVHTTVDGGLTWNDYYTNGSATYVPGNCCDTDILDGNEVYFKDVYLLSAYNDIQRGNILALVRLRSTNVAKGIAQKVRMGEPMSIANGDIWIE